MGGCSSSRVHQDDITPSLKAGIDDYKSVKEQYSSREALGDGGFGTVVRVRHRSTGREYACKQMKRAGIRPDYLKNEVQILRECRHPNIIFLKEVRPDRHMHTAPPRDATPVWSATDLYHHDGRPVDH